MSPLTALWVASVIGAALFFASGVLSAEALQGVLGRALGNRAEGDERPAHEARASAAQRLVANDESWRNDVARVESMAQTHRFEADVLRQRLDVELATKAALDQELEQTRAHAEENARRLAETQKLVAVVPTLTRRLQEVEHVHAARTRAARQTEEKYHTTERELARARGEIARLEAQLAARVGSRSPAPRSDVRGLSEDPTARSVRVEMLTDRIAELEAYAGENAALRSECDSLRRELARLHATRQAVTAPTVAPRVEVDAAGIAALTRPRHSGMTFRARDSEGTLEGSLKQHLSALLAREPGVVAVLADENGFPVAGVGSDEQQEGVSVLTSLAQELALRVQELVDLERIERIELADGTGRALRVRLFDWEAQPLALACLGEGSLVVDPDEERVVTAFPRLLGKVWSA